MQTSPPSLVPATTARATTVVVPATRLTASSPRASRPLAVPIPFHHSNLNSEEMIYYVFGNFGYADAEVIPGAVVLARG